MRRAWVDHSLILRFAQPRPVCLAAGAVPIIVFIMEWSILAHLFITSSPTISPHPLHMHLPPLTLTQMGFFFFFFFGRGVGCKLCISHVHVLFCTFLATCDDACILLEFAFVPGAGEKTFSWCEWGERCCRLGNGLEFGCRH